MTPLLFVLALQGDPKTVRREIQARYNAFDEAVRKHDPSILDGLMTDDFTSDTPEGGTITKKDAIPQFRGLITGSKHAKWPSKVLSVKVGDQEVIATVESKFDGELPGRDGKPHKTELNATKEETWVTGPVGWRMRKSHVIKMTMKLDGKAVNPKG